jgi:hypothetical protein
METAHSFQSHGRDWLPSLLPHHVSRVDIVDVWARSPFAVSGALHGSDSEKAEASSTPHIILVVGFEMPLWFSSSVQVARCQTVHLALSIFSELGQKSPSLATDLEYSSHTIACDG